MTINDTNKFTNIVFNSLNRNFCLESGSWIDPFESFTEEDIQEYAENISEEIIKNLKPYSSEYDLKCKVGDEVWVVINRCHIEKCICETIHITDDGILYEINWSDGDELLEAFDFENNDFGKAVFLIKSEAEEALAKIFDREDKKREEIEENTLDGYKPDFEFLDVCLVIKRPVYGCSLNGVEYVLDKDGNISLFKSICLAKEFLAKNGYDELKIEAEGLDFDEYIVTAKILEFREIMKFAHSNDYWSDKLVREQLRAKWTAYCLRWKQCPDTLTYDNEIRDIFENLNIEEKGVSVQYEAFDLFMSEFLC